MPTNWTLYEDLLGWGAGTTQRDTNVSDALENFLLGIVDDPSYHDDAQVNGTDQPLAVERKSALSCKIIAMPGQSFCIGDIVSCFGENWIVVDAYNDEIGLIRGTIWLCNMSISFQNHSTQIHSRHCVVDDGSYSKRSSDPDAFVPTNTYKMYLPIDDQTIQLYIDKRLSLGKIFDSDGNEILEVYKMIGMDIKSHNIGICSHLMVITLQRDVYDAAHDDIDNDICDVYTDDGGSDTPSETGRCEIVGSKSIRIGTSKKYTATFYDASGTAVEAEAVWTITLPSGSITYTINDNVCTIFVPFAETYIGKSVMISVSDAGNMYGSYQMIVEVITVG